MISHPSKPIFRLTLSCFAGEIVFSDLKYENIVGLNAPIHSPAPPPRPSPPTKTCPACGCKGRDSWSGQMAVTKGTRGG